MVSDSARGLVAVAIVAAFATTARAEGGVYVFGVASDEPSGVLAVRAEAASRNYLGLEALPTSGPLPRILGYEDAHRQAIEQARDNLEAGRRAYLDLDLDRATSLLIAAVGGFDEALGATEPSVATELGNALTLLGAAYVFSNQERAARTIFRRLHVQMPALVPDPNQFPPDVIDRYQQTTPRDRADASGIIEVTSDEPGAAVFIDLRPAGYAPVVVGHLLAGEHSVRVIRPGSAPFIERIDVARGRTSSVRAHFTERADSQGLGDAVHMLVTAAANTQTMPAQVNDVAALLRVQFIGLLHVSAQEGGARVYLRLDLYDAQSSARIFRGERDASTGPGECEAIVRSLVAEGLEVLPSGHRITTNGGDEEGLRNGNNGSTNGGEGRGRASTPVWRKWWFWTAVGGAVLTGVAVGAAVAVSGNNTAGPGSLVLEFPRAQE